MDYIPRELLRVPDIYVRLEAAVAVSDGQVL